MGRWERPQDFGGLVVGALVGLGGLGKWVLTHGSQMLFFVVGSEDSPPFGNWQSVTFNNTERHADCDIGALSMKPVVTKLIVGKVRTSCTEACEQLGQTCTKWGFRLHADTLTSQTAILPLARAL